MTAISWAARVVALIDCLVDRAHRSWPDGYGVLQLPTGESMFLPAHRPNDPACATGHVGYYRTRIGPNCDANPIPRRRGGSGLRPLMLDVFVPHLDAAPVFRHTVDLRTGEVFVDLSLRRTAPRPTRSGHPG